MKNERDRLRLLSGVVSASEILAYLTADRYLSLKEASEYTGFSGRTLRDQDDLPRYRVGKMLRFKKSEVDEWMLKHREGGKAELDELVDETLAKVL
jgi:excisionase family DNA binding protein